MTDKKTTATPYTTKVIEKGRDWVGEVKSPNGNSTVKVKSLSSLIERCNAVSAYS